MKKIFSGFLLIFYIAIIFYVFFAVLNINTLINFVPALIFEMIGFLILAYFVLSNMFSNSIKVGFFIPLLVTTVVYTIVLDVINIACITSVGSVFFTLIHLVVLFVYCLVSIPMYLMGKR